MGKIGCFLADDWKGKLLFWLYVIKLFVYFMGGFSSGFLGVGVAREGRGLIT